MIKIEVSGLRAAVIERACRYSFYGVDKIGPCVPAACVEGREAASSAVREWLEANGIEWNSFSVLSARPLDCDGGKVPYKAEIFFDWC